MNVVHQCKHLFYFSVYLFFIIYCILTKCVKLQLTVCQHYVGYSMFD